MNSIITAIEQQKRMEGRFNVYLDGEFAFGISDADLLGLGLFCGQELSAERIDEILASLDESRCRDYATELVAKRMYTKKEIIRKMQEKGYLKTAIQSTVAVLEEYGYLNDEVYAELYLQQYGKKYGVFKLKYDLKAKGIDEALLDKCLEGFDNSEELLELLGQKFSKRAPSYEEKAKLLRSFVAKGFSYEAVKNAIDRLWGEENEF